MVKNHNWYDSDSEEDEVRLDLPSYQEAQLNQALQRRCDYTRAVQELTQLFQEAYRRYADKAVQELMFEDCLAAVQHCHRQPAARRARQQLVDVASNCLPQAKKARLLREYKRAAVALSRKRGQEGYAVPDDDDDDPCAIDLHDVPTEVVQAIMHLLDPVSLAQAACTCKLWRQLGAADGMWQPHFRALQMPHRCVQACSLSYRQMFADAVTGNQELLVGWESNRALVAGRLAWLPDDSRPGTRYQPGALSVTQVINHMLGRTEESDSSSDCSDDVGTSLHELVLSSTRRKLWRPSSSLMGLQKSLSGISI